MTEYLFLYGTLLPGECDKEVSHIVRKFTPVGAASVPGRLYDFGDYPGAVLDASSDTLVHGELVALPQDHSVFEQLDGYEDFYPSNPGKSLFIRRKTRVTLADGRRVVGWIYVYNGNPDSAPLVDGGDYSKSKVA